MKAKKLVALMLVGGMVFGGVTVADAKKKKKKPRKVVKEVPTPVTLFMRQTAAACSESHEALLLEPSTEDLECWPTDNFFQEIAKALSPTLYDGYFFNDYVAEAGVPFVLDATQPAAGKITIRSWNGAGAGMAELQVILLGTSGGEEKTLGSYATEYQAEPNGKYTFDYEIDVDDALNKQNFESLTLRTIAHGVAVNHGIIELNDPASFVTIPTIVKKTVIKK